MSMIQQSGPQKKREPITLLQVVTAIVGVLLGATVVLALISVSCTAFDLPEGLSGGAVCQKRSQCLSGHCVGGECTFGERELEEIRDRELKAAGHREDRAYEQRQNDCLKVRSYGSEDKVPDDLFKKCPEAFD
jgi:hypothetical protein